MMRLYLDCCCYNRPFDDVSQDRIHDESEAILSLLRRSRNDGTILIGSTVLQMEIDEIRDAGKKSKVESLYRVAKEFVNFDDRIQARAESIQQVATIHTMDSLHLASAEAGRADVFLTTDDKLLRACRNIALSIRVMNPVAYLAEVIGNDGRECE